MNIKVFFTIFLTVLFAELGDKTQLATLLFATDRDNSRLLVLIASAGALVLASGIAVLAGSALGRFINPRYLSWAAGAGFIIIGIWTLVRP